MKRKTSKSQTFQEYLAKYPGTTLQSAAVQINDSIGWALLQSYIRLRQREFEIAALDLIKHNNQVQSAAHASGYAQACEDISERFMQQLVDGIAGKNGLVEGSVPEAE